MTDTLPPVRTSVWTGTLSHIVPATLEGGIPVLSGLLTKTVRGVVVETQIIARGEAVERVRTQFVEGPVAFYGSLIDGAFEVKGLDLRQRTLTKATPRPRSQAQKAAFARFRAAGDAHTTSEPVAA